jgi:hypothetical protein
VALRHSRLEADRPQLHSSLAGTTPSPQAGIALEGVVIPVLVAAALPCVPVTKSELYKFFRELAKPFDAKQRPAPPTPEAMQELFRVAAKYGYWLASPEENAAIGLKIG